MRADTRNRWLGAAFLAALTFLAYFPALRGGFVWDDDRFVVDNPLVRDPHGLARFWFSAAAPDYWPVASTAVWLEWRLWGAAAAGYHAVNLVLHLGSALLIWRLFRRFGLRWAFAGALLFALHPVNVESVAWITQIKNLLAMVFFLLAALFFMDAEKGDRWRGWPYGLSLAAFVLAMLSKGSVAPLPLVLLGWIAWRRRPRWRDAAALAPFFLVAAALTAVNVWFQHHGTSETIRIAGPAERLQGAAAALWFYAAKAALPVRLSFCYPQWILRPGSGAAWLPLVAIAAVGTALAVQCRGRARGPVFAFAYYVVMLLPVLGFADIYFMKYSLVADHYQHLALIGAAGLAAAGLGALAARPRTIALAWATVIVAAVSCAAAVRREAGSYWDRPTLFRVTLAHNPACWMAQNNLGLYLIDHGQFGEALGYCQAAVRLQPGFAEAHNNLGIALAGRGRLDPAADEFSEALRLKADYPQAWNNLGNVRRLQGRLPQAAEGYLRALRLKPGYAEARNNLGVVLMDAGRLDDAVAQYREALRLAPGYGDARDNLVLALRRAGRTAEAEAEARRAPSPRSPAP